MNNHTRQTLAISQIHYPFQLSVSHDGLVIFFLIALFIHFGLKSFQMATKLNNKGLKHALETSAMRICKCDLYADEVENQIF